MVSEGAELNARKEAFPMGEELAREASSQELSEEEKQEAYRGAGLISEEEAREAARKEEAAKEAFKLETQAKLAMDREIASMIALIAEASGTPISNIGDRNDNKNVRGKAHDAEVNRRLKMRKRIDKVRLVQQMFMLRRELLGMGVFQRMSAEAQLFINEFCTNIYSFEGMATIQKMFKNQFIVGTPVTMREALVLVGVGKWFIIRTVEADNNYGFDIQFIENGQCA